MKNLLLILVGVCCKLVVEAQPDARLQLRLNNFMHANNTMNFDTVLAYTYPKLFTLVTRDEMMETLQNTFDNDQVKIGLDSLTIDSIYPVFKMQEGSYAKIRYSMKMIMRFKHKDSDSTQQENEVILAAMQSQFGKEKTSLDKNGNIVIHLTSLMLGAKDKYAKDWCFINLKDGDPIVSQLFSKEIIDKSATFH